MRELNLHLDLRLVYTDLHFWDPGCTATSFPVSLYIEYSTHRISKLLVPVCVVVGGGIEPLSSVRLLLRYWFRRPVPEHRLLSTNLEGLLYPVELMALTWCRFTITSADW